MKKFILILIILFLRGAVWAQIDMRDVPVPKEGPVPKAIPGAQARPVPAEEPLTHDDSRKYGGYLSLGPSLMGFGLLGFEVRIAPAPKVAIETSVSYRPTIIVTQNSGFSGNNSTNVDFYSGVAATIGPTIYFSRKMKSRNTKVVANGMFLKGGYAQGVFRESVYMIGWARERFSVHNPGRSFAVQVGGGFTHLHYTSKQIDQYGLLGVDYSPVISAKIYWNFYVVKYRRG